MSYQSSTEVTTAKAEGMLIQIGLKVLGAGRKNKLRGVADDNKQPTEIAGIRIVRYVLTDVDYQRGDVTLLAITMKGAIIGKDRQISSQTSA